VCESLVYSLSMTGLYFLWYKTEDITSFHFFDDSQQWLQTDKCGHFFASFYVASIQSDLLRFSGQQNSADLIGASVALFAVSSIELFDGVSEKWGASISDVAANALGAGFYLGQIKLFDKIVFKPKYSYHTSDIRGLRPKLFGYNAERLIKDYNGVTFWLSANISDFIENENLPKFVCLSFGYGADGMLGGTNNPLKINDKAVPYFQRYRQFYLSLDFDFAKYNFRCKALNTVTKYFNLKIPFPTIEFSKNKFHFHSLYF